MPVGRTDLLTVPSVARLTRRPRGHGSGRETPPPHLFSPGPDGTLAYYTEISRAVQLPLIIYNVVPWNPISPAIVLRLAEVAGVVAVKQSGGDIHALADLLQAVRATGSRLRVLTAVDALLYPSFLLGAHGAVAALLAVAPRLSVELCCGRPASSVTSTAPVRSMNGCCRYGACWRRRTCPRVKAAIELQGRRVGPARHPLLPIKAEVREQIRTALARAAVTDGYL